MRNLGYLALFRSFVTLDMPWLQTVEMIRILKNNSWGKMLLGICCWGSSHLQLLRQKSNCLRLYCYPICGCALSHHSYQNSIRKLTVSFSDTFKHLINVPRYTSSSLTFAMNSTDHISVVFHKFAYSLISRVTASHNSIVFAIVNSDAYHQSPLIDKLEHMLYV